jgi:hypothetical protein
MNATPKKAKRGKDDKEEKAPAASVKIVEPPAKKSSGDKKAEATVTAVLSPMEAAVLADFRKAKEDATAAVKKFEEVTESQDSWNDILDSDDGAEGVEMFSKFHAHFANIEFMEESDLLQQAKNELREAKQWKLPEKEKVRASLVDALPAMSLAIRDRSVKRKDLSPKMATKAYICILSKFIAKARKKRKAVMKSTRPAKKQKRKTKRRVSDSPQSPSDSGDSDSSRDEDSSIRCVRRPLEGEEQVPAGGSREVFGGPPFLLSAVLADVSVLV